MPQFEYNDAVYCLSVDDWGASLGAASSALRQHLVLSPRDAHALLQSKHVVVAMGLRLELLELERSLQEAGASTNLTYEPHPERVQGAYRLISRK